jgi:plasmid stabilization system protein ParE
MKINYSLESIHDLKRLREFIEIKNSIAAWRIANELLTGIKKLNVFPKIGLSVQHAPDAEIIRDLFIGHYTVRYLISSNTIFILGTWHGKEIEKDL